MDEDLVNYHLKELRYCAQCLIEDDDFFKRLRSTYIYLVLGISSKSRG